MLGRPVSPRITQLNIPQLTHHYDPELIIGHISFDISHLVIGLKAYGAQVKMKLSAPPPRPQRSIAATKCWNTKFNSLRPLRPGALCVKVFRPTHFQRREH
jgi:hypothetical protein